MHELSVVQALLREIEAIAIAHRATAVLRVTVQVGPLSGVESALLAAAFDASRDRCLLERTDLVLESTTVTVRCRECGESSSVTPNHLVCRRCGGYRTTLLTGDELLLQRVELAAASPV